MRPVPYTVLGLLLICCLATSPSRSEELKDLYFGEALYYAHQGQYFEALERLDTEVRQHDEVDEPNLDTLYLHIDDAEFSLGDFELRYRMHHRAGRAIRAVLEGSVDEVVRKPLTRQIAQLDQNVGIGREVARQIPCRLFVLHRRRRAPRHIACGSERRGQTGFERDF